MAKNKEMPKPGKDELVPLTAGQKDPYSAKASDFSVNKVTPGTGQDTGEHGMAEGQDMLAAQGEQQCGPRYIESSGPGPHGSGTPTTWESGGRSGKIASNFPMSKNEDRSTAVDISEGVDFKTGKIVVKGYSETRVDEVGESKVKIPSR